MDVNKYSAYQKKNNKPQNQLMKTVPNKTVFFYIFVQNKTVCTKFLQKSTKSFYPILPNNDWIWQKPKNGKWQLLVIDIM